MDDETNGLLEQLGADYAAMQAEADRIKATIADLRAQIKTAMAELGIEVYDGARVKAQVTAGSRRISWDHTRLDELMHRHTFLAACRSVSTGKPGFRITVKKEEDA